MKCPKCGYLGFEHVDRCRNCGYDFSLTTPADIPDLSISRDTSPNPLEDLSLLDSGLPSNDARTDVVLADLDGPAETPGARRPGKAGGSTPGELPLFGSPAAADDEPLITKASPPRAPLAVRRATPEIPRVREAPRASSLDLALDEPEQPAPASFDSWS